MASGLLIGALVDQVPIELVSASVSLSVARRTATSVYSQAVGSGNVSVPASMLVEAAVASA